jgi:putative transposase
MTAKLAVLAAHGSTSSIRRLCAVLGVARSWFQDWQASAQTRSSESRAEADLVDQIRGVFQHSGQRSGAPRIHAELQANGVRIARKRVARLMRENRLRPPRRKKRPPITTDSRHGDGIAPNLLQRAFKADRPNTIWLADITSVAPDEGWLYLAAVKDMAPRAIVGGSRADPLRRSLCEKALMMAIQHRAPPRGLIHHSDRGVQYACGPYRKILDRYGIQASMSRKGDGYEPVRVSEANTRRWSPSSAHSKPSWFIEHSSAPGGKPRRHCSKLQDAGPGPRGDADQSGRMINVARGPVWRGKVS